MGKIKLFLESEKGKDVIIVAILVLSSLGSFLLGRLSQSEGSESIQIEYMDSEGLKPLNMTSNSSLPVLDGLNTTKNANPESSSKSGYFGSSRGTKYYPVDCRAGDNIKKENRIYFDTETAAEKAGYTLSASCD